MRGRGEAREMEGVMVKGGMRVPEGGRLGICTSSLPITLANCLAPPVCFLWR